MNDKDVIRGTINEEVYNEILKKDKSKWTEVGRKMYTFADTEVLMAPEEREIKDGTICGASRDVPVLAVTYNDKSYIEYSTRDKLKAYWRYTWSVLVHKFYVAIELLKFGQIWLALSHDVSKFYPDEFIPAAEFFYLRPSPPAVRQRFTKSRYLHKRRNAHHVGYWDKSQPIPLKYFIELISDWKARDKEKYSYPPIRKNSVINIMLEPISHTNIKVEITKNGGASK